jgi:stage II sporulation protein E
MIQKAEKEIVSLDQPKGAIVHAVDKLQERVEIIFLKWGLLLAVVGFLLGRALILEQVSPFALPFFASVFMMKKDKSGFVFLAIVFGAMSVTFLQSAFVFSAIFMFLLVRFVVAKFVKDPLKALPTTVFLASLTTRFLFTYVEQSSLTGYDMMMAFVEAGLSLILTMIFIQGVPVITNRKRKQALKNEEIICLIILLASVMTGTIGWTIYDMSVEHILSRYLVMIFAFVGGAAIGSTVGVVTGLILSLANVASLYQMSLLAFSGLMGGLLKDGKKLGVSLGLMIGTFLIGLYGEGNSALMPTIMESVIAMTLFLFTPQTVIRNLARHIPGTEEHSAEQMQYLQKVRDVTAYRVEQFSSLFQVLSNSFSHQGLLADDEDDTKEIDYFLSNVAEKTCQTCFRKSKCWEQNFNKTYDYMIEIMQESERESPMIGRLLHKEWDRHCIKADKVIDTIQKELSFYQANQKLKKQVQESRRLVADQLLGVSQVMKDFAFEIQRERENHHMQEEQIVEALHSMGIEIAQADIFSLEEGNVDIELSIPYCNGRGECEKIIAPMLSDILGEMIIVKHEECAPYPNGYCHVSLGSAKAYVVEPGVAHVAKGGAWVSGDSYSTIELGTGKYAVAISDGMGNGERAHIESKETLTLLQKILQSGIEEKVAIKSVNSVLSLRTTDEIFSTLDLAMIDLQDASAKFLKIGSSPSFIKRGSKVIKVEAGNLPMGIIPEFEVDVVSEQLKAGDLLIMMSDGVFEGPKHVENYELWMKRKVSDLTTDDPQDVADLILEEVIRTRSGSIQDDMTVVVARIDHNTPKWATIPVYNHKKAQ